MKVREEGRDVKSANRLLRQIDWEETLEQEEEESRGEAKESLMQIVTDLNYLARELAKEGKEETRSILLKVVDIYHNLYECMRFSQTYSFCLEPSLLIF